MRPGGTGDGLHAGAGGERAVGGEGGGLLRVQGALPDGDLDIAAEDAAAVGGKAALDRRGEGAGGGERRDAEEQAGDEQAQAGKAPR